MASSPDLPRFRRRLALGILLAALPLGAETTFYQDRIGPILDRHCVVCHGPEKQKAGLRLDSFAWVMKGAESGAMVLPGNAAGSELYRRITLPAGDDDVMPTDGKPLLSREEIRNVELWILGGASATKVVAEFPGAPALGRPKPAPAALAPDWRPRADEIRRLETELGVRLVPRSQQAGDGLILRTAGSPRRGDDAALARLAPIAELIVEAELARTPVTDAGLAAVGRWTNLRSLDLSRTLVTGQGVAALAGLPHLEALNLTDSAVDAAGIQQARAFPALRRLWAFGAPGTATTEVRP
ncbi:MAG: c-type cytochrome domain-containing protein [Opitutaceae bacterium]